MDNFSSVLRQMDNFINETLRFLSQDLSFSKILLLGLGSSLYGILHSLGPGHGKALVASFFIKEEHKLRKSVTLSLIISLIHTGSAIFLSLLFYFVLTRVRGMLRIRIQSYFIVASGILIIILGIFFLIRKITNKDHCHSPSKNGNGAFTLVGISGGIVPCPVSLMIMTFSLSAGIPLVGLFSVFGISLGMFVLLSALGSLIISSRTRLVSCIVSERKNIILSIIEFGSIAFMIFLGVSMSSSFILGLIT